MSLHQINDGVNFMLRSVGIKSKTGSQITQAQKSAAFRGISGQPLWQASGSHINIIRLAGFSGATAVALAAFGAHRVFCPENKEQNANLKSIFDTANRFHFIHSIALLGVPLARKPALTCSLMMAGTLMFCLPCYYRSLTGDVKFNRLAPIGGMCLILAWLSLAL